MKRLQGFTIGPVAAWLGELGVTITTLVTNLTSVVHINVCTGFWSSNITSTGRCFSSNRAKLSNLKKFSFLWLYHCRCYCDINSVRNKAFVRNKALFRCPFRCPHYPCSFCVTQNNAHDKNQHQHFDIVSHRVASWWNHYSQTINLFCCWPSFLNWRYAGFPKLWPVSALWNLTRGIKSWIPQNNTLHTTQS